MPLDPITSRKQLIDSLLKDGAITKREANRMKEIVDEHLASPTTEKKQELRTSFSWRWIFGLVLALSLILILISIFPFFQDSDQDGISNYDDLCVAEAGTKVCQGCPDRDLDSIKDLEDICPDIPGSRALNGCSDFDLDGVIDAYDDCPMDSGDEGMHGCKKTTRMQQKIKIFALAKKVKKCKTKTSESGTEAHEKSFSWVANDSVYSLTVTHLSWKSKFELTLANIESNFGKIKLTYCKEKGKIYFIEYLSKETQLEVYCLNGVCYNKNGNILLAEPEFSFDFKLMLTYLYQSEKLISN